MLPRMVFGRQRGISREEMQAAQLEIAQLKWEECETPAWVAHVGSQLASRLQATRDYEAALRGVGEEVYAQILAETGWPELALAAAKRVRGIFDDMVAYIEERKRLDGVAKQP